MWRAKYGTTRPLDSALLFVEVERQAQSPNASEEDANNYAILKSFRKKQEEMAGVIDTLDA